ncbi:MAG: TonB-dependent receptor plug domain-containing protein, partial [Pyrinomonadaceae bacterium]
ADSFAQLNEDPQPVGTLPSGVINAVPLSPAELRRFEAGTPVSELNLGAANFIPSSNDPDRRQSGRFFSGAVVFTQRPAEAFGYTISYQGLDTSRVSRNGSDRLDFDGRVHTLNARGDLRLGASNLVTAGYEFEHEGFVNRTSSNLFAPATETEATQRSHSVFVQDQLRFLDDRLQLSAAFRAQFFSLNRPRFTPGGTSPFGDVSFEAPPDAYTGDGSVAYLFRARGTKLRAHVGNGYRAPSLFERFGTFFFSGSFFAFGNPRLRPDRSVAFDAGVDQELFGNRLRASATYFYTRLQEVIAFEFTGYSNTGGGLARGAELSMSVAPTRALDLFASYTYTNSDQRTPQTGGHIRSFVIPDHQLAVVATQRFGRRLLVNFDLVAASDYLNPIFDPTTFSSRVYRFDGFVKADLGASYTVPLGDAHSLRLFGKVENLTGRDNYEAGFRTAGRTGVAGAAYSF